MAKERSKKTKKTKKTKKSKKTRLGGIFRDLKNFINKKRKARINPHKSFKRSYREDYRRDLEIPGILQHIFKSFGMIFKNCF